MKFLPPGFKPWPKNRRKYRFKWGDPTGEVFEADKEYGSYCHSDRLTTLHPHLRRKEFHDLLWEVRAHESLHAFFPNLGHARIAQLERMVGQYLHDLAGCRQCAASSRPPKPASSRS